MHYVKLQKLEMRLSIQLRLKSLIWSLKRLIKIKIHNLDGFGNLFKTLKTHQTNSKKLKSNKNFLINILFPLTMEMPSLLKNFTVSQLNILQSLKKIHKIRKQQASMELDFLPHTWSVKKLQFSQF